MTKDEKIEILQRNLLEMCQNDASKHDEIGRLRAALDRIANHIVVEVEDNQAAMYRMIETAREAINEQTGDVK